MREKQPIQAIIFDMDNTLLRSNIDFGAMKRDIYQLLANRDLCPAELHLDNHTTSTLIDLARQSAAYTKEIDMQVWELAAVHEQRGMVGADLEPEAKELLQFLQGRVILTLLTNNALAAAQQALEETGIRHYFSSLAGREQMSALKPSPSGFHYLLGAYPQIPLDSWLSVGDSWIDGQAAQEAGIAFLAYRAKCADLESRGIQAMGYLTELGEIIKYLE